MLGLIDAALGQKEEALREVRQAVELLPVEKDAINGVGDDQIFSHDRPRGLATMIWPANNWQLPSVLRAGSPMAN